MTYTGLLTTEGLFSTLIFSSTGSGRSVVNRLCTTAGTPPSRCWSLGTTINPGWSGHWTAKQQRLFFLNNDWMWMWWVYSNYNKLLNIRHESKISLYSCRRTVKTTVKRKKKLPTPQKKPKQTNKTTFKYPTNKNQTRAFFISETLLKVFHIKSSTGIISSIGMYISFQLYI